MGLKKTFHVTGSPGVKKSVAAALTPSYLRRASSSDTPTHTWSGQYQVSFSTFGNKCKNNYQV